MTKASPHRARELATSAILALTGGILWALCFAAEERLLLPWLALVPLVALATRRRAFWWGWLHGVAFWGGSLPWLIDTVVTHGGLSRTLSVALFLLLIVYLGLPHGLFTWLGAKMLRRGGWMAYLGLPALWMVLELTRGLPVGRFPWNWAAYGWIATPGVLPLASWIGALGLSGLLVWMSVAWVRSWQERRLDPALWAVLLVTTALVLAGRFAHAEPGPGRSQVLVIQPDTPILAPDEAWPYYQRLVAMSHEACRAAGEALLIWPESAAWPLNYVSSPRLQADVAALNTEGCTMIVGAATFEDTQVFNSALLLGPAGELGRYSKRQLVPYGEYVPLSEVLPFVGTLARNAGSFTPGSDVGLLPWRDEQLGMAICYEVVFPGAVVEQVRAGATALVNITNDAWYGDTAAPHQHFRAVRFRAAENRRPLLRSALTGISALVDARGAVVEELGVGERDVLEGRLAGVEGLSPYSRTPWLVPSAAWIVLGFAIVRLRSGAGPRPQDTPAAARH